MYLWISCVSSFSFPAAFGVLVFHVPLVMLSLPRILDGAPVAYSTPPPWCTAEGAVLVSCHFMETHGQGTTWRSPFLSRSNTWPLGSSWNLSAHLTVLCEPWRHPPSDVLLTPAILSITRRLVEGGSVLFLPVQVQRTCPLVKMFFSHHYCRVSNPQLSNYESGAPWTKLSRPPAGYLTLGRWAMLYTVHKNTCFSSIRL